MLAEIQCKSETAVQAYIDGVLSGNIVACKYVKLAVQRHLRDLETGHERELYFDPEAAQIVIDFFGLLRHSKGKWAGQPFILDSWQMFIVWVLFGWKKADGSRRFRVAYDEVAKKNGKSTLAAAVGLYGLFCDGEQGAEIYSFATKEEQARIVFDEGQRMTIKSGCFGGRATVHKKSISIDSTYSSWKPLGSDSDRQDGLNPHFAIADELHAHRDSGMWDQLRSAVGARRQPLMFAITTAGFNRQSFCYQQRDYAIKVLEGVIEDDSFFAIIFTLDYDENGQLLDDWKDESVWIKANPNLGVSVSIEDMRDMCREAIESPSKLNNFLCKKLNIWTTQKVKWVNLERWDACTETVDESVLIGKPCFGGLDLSSNTDITAFVMLFPLSDGKFAVVPRFWIPEENARERERKDKVPYVAWAKQGYIRMTAGNVIDYATIQADIFKDCQQYGMDSIAFDRWNFEAIRQRLVAEGIPEDKMIAFGQGYASMSAPMKELEKLYLAQQLIHNGNPVLRWMAENVAAKTDPAGNIKPDKEKSSEKIDGIAALIEALGLAITKPAKKESVYESRGVLDLG